MLSEWTDTRFANRKHGHMLASRVRRHAFHVVLAAHKQLPLFRLFGRRAFQSNDSLRRVSLTQLVPFVKTSSRHTNLHSASYPFHARDSFFSQDILSIQCYGHWNEERDGDMANAHQLQESTRTLKRPATSPLDHDERRLDGREVKRTRIGPENGRNVLGGTWYVDSHNSTITASQLRSISGPAILSTAHCSRPLG